MKVKITRIREGVNLPEYKTAGAACMDVEVSEDVTIKPNEYALLPSGLVVKTPDDYVLFIAPRSSLAKKGLVMPHSFGLLDPDYCGPEDELKILLKNVTDSDIFLKKGERTAQLLFVKLPKIEWDEVHHEKIKSKTSRGGFGSTGR